MNSVIFIRRLTNWTDENSLMVQIINHVYNICDVIILFPLQAAGG